MLFHDFNPQSLTDFKKQTAEFCAKEEIKFDAETAANWLPLLGMKGEVDKFFNYVDPTDIIENLIDNVQATLFKDVDQVDSNVPEENREPNLSCRFGSDQMFRLKMLVVLIFKLYRFNEGKA